jgi:hypothetical protein
VQVRSYFKSDARLCLFHRVLLTIADTSNNRVNQLDGIHVPLHFACIDSVLFGVADPQPFRPTRTTADRAKTI